MGATRALGGQTAEDYLNGTLLQLELGGRSGYLIRPTGTQDLERRWVWIVPHWLGLSDESGVVQHRFYIESLLAKGLCVAGIDVGVTFGSPAGAQVFQRFYEMLTGTFNLNDRCRMIAQSNGGLIACAWAFRHPAAVDRIFGIYPVVDYFTWPPGGLTQVAAEAEPGLGYQVDVDDLRSRANEFNPIDNLAPLVAEGVQLFLIHGDDDQLVPLASNSMELQSRYQILGGECTLKVLAGVGHGGSVVYDQVRAVRFLLESWADMSSGMRE